MLALEALTVSSVHVREGNCGEKKIAFFFMLEQMYLKL
jgi:hypothetical protein